MVESIDDSVGRVMTTLKELGLDENTVILFTSDNGGLANTTSNVPLRANKGAYYEGGIRAPLIIKRPGVTKLGLVVNEPVKACWPCGRSSGTTRTTTSIRRVSPAVSSGKVHGSSSKPSTPGASNSTTSLTTSAKPKNLASIETAKLAELRRELEAWREEVSAEMMKPNPEYDPSVKPAKKKKEAVE